MFNSVWVFKAFTSYGLICHDSTAVVRRSDRTKVWRQNCPSNQDGPCSDEGRGFHLTGPKTVKLLWGLSVEVHMLLVIIYQFSLISHCDNSANWMHFRRHRSQCSLRRQFRRNKLSRWSRLRCCSSCSRQSRPASCRRRLHPYHPRRLSSSSCTIWFSFSRCCRDSSYSRRRHTPPTSRHDCRASRPLGRTPSLLKSPRFGNRSSPFTCR